MSRTRKTELAARMAEEERARAEAIARGDALAARDCETAYRALSDELYADED